MSPRLTLAGRSLAGPVWSAAGCTGSGVELARFGALAGVGALVIGPIATAPTAARSAPPPPPRSVPGGVVHHHARPLAVTHVAARVLPRLAEAGVEVVAALAGDTSADLAAVAAHLAGSPAMRAVAAIELDLTRVNLADTHRGEEPRPFSGSVLAVTTALTRVRESLPRGVPVLVKLGHESLDPVAAVRAAESAGAAGVVIAPSLPVDAARRLSGPATREPARALLARLLGAVDAGRLPAVPVVAAGGFTTREHVREALAAGAFAVQVGTAALADPRALWRLSTPDPATATTARSAP